MPQRGRTASGSLGFLRAPPVPPVREGRPKGRDQSVHGLRSIRRYDMPEVIGRFSPQAFALLRLISGIMFFLHGSQKFFGWPPDHPPGTLPPILVVASWIEMVAGLMIVIGFFSGIAAFIASGE